MITKKTALEMAAEWCAAWNNRSIDDIMVHYSEDVIFYSPTVVARWGQLDGRLSGKEWLKKNFLMGMQLMPDLHFELVDVLLGNDGYTVIYRRETGKLVADVIITDENNKGKIVKTYYS